MVYLLDVNVLVALFDPSHIHHDAAHHWLGGIEDAGWATCPITENGFVRVISNPGYPGRRTRVADAVERLRSFTERGDHVFWPDDVSILDLGAVAAHHLTGHREVTDAFLLALAAHHGGALATFDQGVRLEAAPAAGSDSLEVVPAGR